MIKLKKQFTTLSEEKDSKKQKETTPLSAQVAHLQKNTDGMDHVRVMN